MAPGHCSTRRVGAAAAGLLSALLFADQAHAAQATGTASASILSPVIISKQSDLAFGKIIASTAASSVTISSAGAFTCGTGLTCLDPHSAARFSVFGAPGQTVRVDVDQTVTLTSANGGRMTAVLQPSATVMTLSASERGGMTPLLIGGVLTVGAYQLDGIYTGTFTVNIDYS